MIKSAVVCFLVAAWVAVPAVAWGQTEGVGEPTPTSAPASAPAVEPAAEPAPVAAPPVAETPAPEAAPAKADDDDADPYSKLVKRYPFRGTTFSWAQSLSALSLDAGADQTYNPYYAWLLRIQPRYYINKKLSVRLKVGLGVEWTNSDSTTTYQEPLWEDIWVDGSYASVYTEKYTKISVTPSLRLILPASKASQARTLYFGIQPGFQLMRGFKLPYKMKLMVGYAFAYAKYLNEYTTAQYDAPTILSCSSGDGTDCGRFMHSGVRNPSHVVTNSFLANLQITKKLSAGFMFGVINQILYDVTDADVELAGGTIIDVPTDPNADVNHRAAMLYSFEASYNLHRMVALGFEISTFTPQLAPDSSYRAPFFNRYTEFVLTTTVNLDQVVATVHRRLRPSGLVAQAD